MKKTTNKYYTFRDLVFRPHPLAKGALKLPASLREYFGGNPKQARLSFQNGYGVSALIGKMFYSNGINTYEVGIMKNNSLASGTFIGEFVQGRRTSKEVTAIMIRLQKMRR